MITFFLLLLLLVLIAIGIPVAFSLGLVTLLLYLSEGVSLTAFAQEAALGADSYTLLAIPLFVLTGKIMNAGGITHRILRFANAVVGHIRGGLAHANVVSSMVFAGISGAAVADAAGMGAVEIEAMKRGGYRKDFSAAVTAASAVIGPIIPPSIVMIIYGITAAVPIGDLFIGGIIPGILMGISLMGLIAYFARSRDLPVQHSGFSARELAASTVSASAALITPIIIVGGIVAGVFTVTEAGAAAAVYSLFVSTVIYRELSIKQIWITFKETMFLSANILLIVAFSAAFAWIIALQGLPAIIAGSLLTLSSNALVIFAMLAVIYLILGTFMEAVAIITITVPIVLPVIEAVGIDPIYFGVVLAILLSIGTITPPLGIVLFVITEVADVKLVPLVKALIPFFLVLLGVVLLLTFFPQLVLYLPSVL